MEKQELMGKSLSSDSARARSQKQRKEASRRAAPDARERIPTGAGGAAAGIGWKPMLQSVGPVGSAETKKHPKPPLSRRLSWLTLLRLASGYSTVIGT